MSWLWFARSPQPMPGTLASAALTTFAGNAAGFVLAWPADQERPDGAAKVAVRPR